MRSLNPYRRKRGIAECQSGVAMVEFALSLPLLLLLILGGLEVSRMALTHMRVSQIAMGVADNAGRARVGIDESNIYELFSGAELIGKSLGFSERGRIVLSSLQPNGKTGSNEGQMINWQRCFGVLPIASRYGVQGTGRNNAALASGMGPTGSKIRSASGTAVMFAEVTYRYEPFVTGFLGWEPFFIRYESAFNVRERTNQDITNTQQLSVRGC